MYSPPSVICGVGPRGKFPVLPRPFSRAFRPPAIQPGSSGPAPQPGPALPLSPGLPALPVSPGLPALAGRTSSQLSVNRSVPRRGKGPSGKALRALEAYRKEIAVSAVWAAAARDGMGTTEAIAE